MNALNATQTMSSREIAELVESRHDSVKRTMETLAGKGLISFSQTVETSHAGPGVIAGYAPTAYTHPQNEELH